VVGRDSQVASEIILYNFLPDGSTANSSTNKPMASSSFLVGLPRNTPPLYVRDEARQQERGQCEATHAGAGRVVGPDSASHWGAEQGREDAGRAGQGRSRL
jgi:hypothetical protein